MMFLDRKDAGQQLARELVRYKDENAVILALPRGGVPVGFEVAQMLGAPLDILIVRKIGAPDQPELALGALVGGSIAQIGLVLGICALAAPLRARLKLFGWANPALIVSIVLFWLLSLDAKFGVVDGVILIAAYVVVTVLVIRAARSETADVRNELASATGTSMLVWRDGARVVIGVVALPFAAVWLVQGSLALATYCAVSPLVIGLTVLGGATALASVPPTVTAARRNQGD